MPSSPARDDPIGYARQLRAEVSAEAERIRADDPGIVRLERDIERAWAALSPPDRSAEDGDSGIARAERLAYVDVDVGLGDRRGVRQVKGVVRRLVHWYLRHLADQLNVWHNVVVRWMKRADRRIAQLEQAQALSTGSPALLDPVPDVELAVAGEIVTLVESAVGESTGMIAVLSCGEGAVAAALDGSGILAYGVDSDPGRIAEGLRVGLDLRTDDPERHLESVPDGSLAGLVLTGFVDDLALAKLLGLLDEARRVVATGGVVVVAAPDPAGRGPVERDLRTGRGMAPPSWAHLLGRAGWTTRLQQLAVEGSAGAGSVSALVVARRP